MRQGDGFSAPKADALPGCATPRAAVSLGIAPEKGKPESVVRGNAWRNAARTGVETPELSPNRVARLFSRKPNWAKLGLTYEDARRIAGRKSSWMVHYLRARRDGDCLRGFYRRQHFANRARVGR